jgi:large subunit ribosomal protein L19
MPTNKLEEFNKEQLKSDLPNLKPGDTVKVYQKIKDKGKERIQVFEGQILAIKHGKGINATITVRRMALGYGTERVFPIHSPLIDKIEIEKRGKVRRAKLYYLRGTKGKKARIKQKELVE